MDILQLKCRNFLIYKFCLLEVGRSDKWGYWIIEYMFVCNVSTAFRGPEQRKKLD